MDWPTVLHLPKTIRWKNEDVPERLTLLVNSLDYSSPEDLASGLTNLYKLMDITEYVKAYPGKSSDVEGFMEQLINQNRSNNKIRDTFPREALDILLRSLS